MEDPLKGPGEQTPDRVARRVRYAEIVRGNNQLAGVFQSDRGLKRQGVDKQRDEKGKSEGEPIGAAEERCFVQNTSLF